jgi:L-asparaginase
MTTEAAVAKLYYLFSCGLDGKAVKKMMEADIAGELSI